MGAAEQLKPLLDLFQQLVNEAVRTAIKAEREAENDVAILYTNEQAAKMIGITPAGLLKRVQRGAVVPDERLGDDGRGYRYSMATIKAAKAKGRR